MTQIPYRIIIQTKLSNTIWEDEAGYEMTLNMAISRAKNFCKENHMGNDSIVQIYHGEEQVFNSQVKNLF